jgi:hypothetical protein
MDEQLPNTNIPEESKPSDPNQQLSKADLDDVVGGVKKPAADPKGGYLTVTMEDLTITSI